MADQTPEMRASLARQTTQEALKLGFPITCATCTHLHNAWDSKAEDCGYTTTCGGPLFGRAFPDYLGPVKRDMFAKFCLICGDRHTTHQVIAGKERLGLCDEHKAVFDNIRDLGTSMPLIIAERKLEV